MRYVERKGADGKARNGTADTVRWMLTDRSRRQDECTCRIS